MNILTTVSILAPSFPPVLHAMFTVPNIALTNAMACRVFRQLRLGILMEKPLTQASQQSGPIQLLPTRASRRYTRSGGLHTDIDSILAPDERMNKTSIVAVHIQRDVEATAGDFVHDLRQSTPPLKPAGLEP